MVWFVLGIMFLIRTFRNAAGDPAFRVLAMACGLILLAGTLFYPIAEDWSLLDSLYFSVITLTTIGYGDYAPASTAGKIFTIVYVFVGLGFLFSFVTMVAQRSRVWAKMEEEAEAAKNDENART